MSMENMGGEFSCEKKSVIINELVQGRELAKKLQMHLHMSSSSSHDIRGSLAQEILNSYEKVLSYLGGNDPSSESMHLPTCLVSELLPISVNGRPRSLDLDREFQDQGNKDGYTTRRKWTKQVQVCLGRELEGPLDDGYSWRKYGQKDILGAKYPRGYYRCTQRNMQNCLATKQVQRSDKDPTIFHITYCGVHSCNQPTIPTQNKPFSSTNISSPKQAITLEQPAILGSLDVPKPVSQEVFLDFKTGLTVLTQDHSFTPSSFCLPSTSSPIMPDSNNYYISPPFVNPNGQVSYYNNGESGYQSLHYSSESELTDIISAATSATNSPTVAAALDSNPTFGNQVESDPSFTFDNPWIV